MMAKQIDKPRIRVDFNEMVESNLVLLSKEDFRIDSSGNRIEMIQGAKVYIYEDDIDIDGNPDFLVADGTIERNTYTDWSAHVKWCCRIDENKFRHLSEIEENL